MRLKGGGCPHTRSRTTRYDEGVKSIWLWSGVGVVLALAGAFVSGMLLWQLPRHGVATLSDPLPQPSVESVFDASRPVLWRGTIIGTLAGGRGLAVQRNPADAEHPFFEAYFAGEPASMSAGPVIIEGAWVGMSCAYANSLFNGRCVPEVNIDAIASLPDDATP